MDFRRDLEREREREAVSKKVTGSAPLPSLPVCLFNKRQAERDFFAPNSDQIRSESVLFAFGRLIVVGGRWDERGLPVISAISRVKSR
jgi:hypothetical protein